MKFQAEIPQGQHIIQRYDEQGIVISGTLCNYSVLFGSDLPTTAWHTATPTLSLEMCQEAFNACPDQTEVLLIGTGSKQMFPSVEVRRFFAEKNCPVEYMSTPAACRTYNILSLEGRQVVAALVIETTR